MAVAFDSGKDEAASKVLRKHFSTLMKVIDPLKFAADLYSEDIVDRATLKEVRVSSEGNAEKACDILDMISDKVKENPDVFETLCCILEKEDSTKECVRIMRDDYHQHFMIRNQETEDKQASNPTEGSQSIDWTKTTKPQLSPQVGDECYIYEPYLDLSPQKLSDSMYETASYSEDSTLEDSPVSETQNTSQRTANYAWFQNAKEFLDKIRQNANAIHFIDPVDTKTHGNYLEVVNKPMDLTTIGNRLHSQVYNSPYEFLEDIELIFKNSRKYNNDENSLIYEMTTKLHNFFDKHKVGFLESCKGGTAYGTRSTFKKCSLTDMAQNGRYPLAVRNQPLPKYQMDDRSGSESPSPIGRNHKRPHVPPYSDSETENGDFGEKNPSKKRLTALR